MRWLFKNRGKATKLKAKAIQIILYNYFQNMYYWYPNSGKIMNFSNQIQNNHLNQWFSNLFNINNKQTNCMARRTKQKCGKWNKTQHQKFMKALSKYGKNWSMIQKCVQSRTLTQVRSHAQKLFLGMSSQQLQNFQYDLKHRQDMFCDLQKKNKLRKQQEAKCQYSSSDENQNTQKSQVKQQNGEKFQDSKITLQKKTVSSQLKQIDQKKTQSMTIVAPSPNFQPIELIRSSILQSCIEIQLLRLKLTQNSNFPIGNFPFMNTFDPNLQQMNILPHLNWFRY